ncbi:hypothetical protein B0H19DRAFT_1193145 [Mycena capillaripes]|nr:hypothetical protein B0H19DRAFT_1193145 [Mycena capillaripes]
MSARGIGDWAPVGVGEYRCGGDFAGALGKVLRRCGPSRRDGPLSEMVIVNGATRILLNDARLLPRSLGGFLGFCTPAGFGLPLLVIQLRLFLACTASPSTNWTGGVVVIIFIVANVLPIGTGAISIIIFIFVVRVNPSVSSFLERGTGHGRVAKMVVLFPNIVLS